MGEHPVNEIVAGILAVLMWGGTFVLLIINRPIPEIVGAGDLAVITYFLSAHSYNSGVEHGVQKTKDILSNGNMP